MGACLKFRPRGGRETSCAAGSGPGSALIGGLLLGVAMLVVACGSDNRADVGVVAVGSAPGTSLGDGFEVVDGSALIGDPVPAGTSYYTNGQPVIDDGWTATLVVDGRDPTDIIGDYLRAAETNGFEIVTPTGCGEYLEASFCTGFARSRPASFESLTVESMRGSRDDVALDHVVVQFSTLELLWHEGERLQESFVSGDENRDPVAWPPLPQVGEGLGTGGEVTRSVVIEPGSRLAGPVRLTVNDVTGGIYAILEVTGDSDDVLGRYVDQLEKARLMGPPAQVEEAAGAVITRVRLDEAGGDAFQLMLVERADRPTWLVIEGSHD